MVRYIFRRTCLGAFMPSSIALYNLRSDRPLTYSSNRQRCRTDGRLEVEQDSQGIREARRVSRERDIARQQKLIRCFPTNREYENKSGSKNEPKKGAPQHKSAAKKAAEQKQDDDEDAAEDENDVEEDKDDEPEEKTTGSKRKRVSISISTT